MGRPTFESHAVYRPGRGLALFVAPGALIPLWPWPLAPLTAQVVDAIFCLGCVGLLTWRDPRWSRLGPLLSIVMIVAIMVAAVRARAELAPNRMLTWLLTLGFVAVLAGALRLRWLMRRAAGRT